MKKCERQLGGKQCPDDSSSSNKRVFDGDFMFRTTSCETSACPGKVPSGDELMHDNRIQFGRMSTTAPLLRRPITSERELSI